MSIQLKAEKYWEWRTTIEEMQHGETKLKVVRLSMALMEKELEVQRLRISAYKDVVRTSEAEAKDLKKHYFEFRDKLSEELGIKLEDCAIDPYTFEVKLVNEIEKG